MNSRLGSKKGSSFLFMPRIIPRGKAIRKASEKPANTRYRLISTCLNSIPFVINCSAAAAVLIGDGII